MILMLVMGMFMDGTSIAVLLVPLLWPVAKELGISVWSSQKRLQRIRKKLCKQLLPNKSKKISENMSVLRF